MSVARPAATSPTGVPAASWWSPNEIEVSKGHWCREPPTYAARKPPLPIHPLPVDWKDSPQNLTREFVFKHASPNNFIIATYINFKRLDFAFTMVQHLIALRQPHYIVGAMDEPALKGLIGRGVPAFYINSGLTTQDYGWGTPNFRKMGLHKVQLVLDLAKLGVDALTVDADAFILREPWQYIRRYPRADVLMSSDLLRATRGYNHTGLEDASGFGADYNIGYIFIRHTAIEFVQQWRDKCFRFQSAWDQQLFASVLRGGARGGAMTAKNLRPMFRTKSGRALLAGVLPVALFASGHTFFVTRMAHQMRRQPFMVHTTFQYGGAEGKRHRLREGMMWEDGPEYYSKPDFLTFTPDVPYNLIYPGGPSTVKSDGSVDRKHWMTVDQHFKVRPALSRTHGPHRRWPAPCRPVLSALSRARPAAPPSPRDAPSHVLDMHPVAPHRTPTISWSITSSRRSETRWRWLRPSAASSSSRGSSAASIAIGRRTLASSRAPPRGCRYSSARRTT